MFSQQGVFVDAGGAERAAADPGGDLATFEVAEELLPFLIRGRPVLLAGPHGPASGEESQVGLDGLLGIDGLVGHGDADVLVACDDLGDVRRQPVEDGVGDEDSPEVVGRVVQWSAVVLVDQAGVGQGLVEEGGDEAAADHVVLGAEPALKQQRGGRQPDEFLPVAGTDERHGPVAAPDAADDGAQRVGKLGADRYSLN